MWYFACFCEFHGSATVQNIRSPDFELRHLHYTNCQLKIFIWRLYFSSWSPKGDLRIFLISSLALIWTRKGQNQLSALQRCIEVGNVWFLPFLGPNKLSVIKRCPYYRGVCKERLDCIFFLDSIKYITKWGKNILYIYLICFGVTYKKIFLRLLTEQN